jgi:hypothetical protein
MFQAEAVARAERWLDEQLGRRQLPQLLVVIGLGAGELLEVLDRRSPRTRVLAFEPDPAAARDFGSDGRGTTWRDAGRLTYFAGPEYSGADQAWRVFPSDVDDHALVIDPVTAKRHREGATAAAKLVKRIVFGAKANAEARRQFAPRYLVNSLRNAPAMLAGRDIRSLAGAYTGVSAVIAAAGPSLDLVLDDLHAVAGRALLVAVDTALRPLLEHGLHPAIAVGMDPGERNARHFQSLPPSPATWLVAESALDPSVVRAFGERTFWFRVANHQPWPWFRDLGLDTGQIDVWGSVLTAAFQTAVLAGCDPIVIVGADLAYTNGRPYARGTTYEHDWAYSAAIGADLDAAWRMQAGMFEQVRVPDLHGVETLTTAPLQAFRDWMVTQAGRCGRRIVNATGEGILFGAGIEQSSLRAVLTGPCAIPAIVSVSSAAFERPSPQALARDFVALSGRTAEASAAPVGAWIEFSAGGYDADAVARALDEAARALASGGATAGSRTPPGPTDAPCGADVVSGGSAPRAALLERLPESIARLRAVLNSDGALPAIATADRLAVDSASVLEVAAQAYGPAHAALSAFLDDERTPLVAEGVGVTPVSGLRAWPSAIAWPLQRFEALLGQALSGAWPGPEASFFSRPVIGRQPRTVGMPRSSPARFGGRIAAGRLALEWLLCASHAAHRPEIAGRLFGLFRALNPAETNAGFIEPVAIAVSAHPARVTEPVEFSLTAEGPRLARALTGVISPVGEQANRAVRLLVDDDGLHSGDAVFPSPLVITPRVLTDEGVARAVLGYTSDRGAVFAPLLGTESFVVWQDGTIEPRHSWPRPIVGELPFGDDGAVAWNNWPETGPSYVMYRPRAGDDPVIEDLPFRPAAGAWWRGRLYWTLFPSGFGSWMPGDPVLESPDVSLLGLHAHATGISLATCLRDENGGARRERPASAWEWSSDRRLREVPLGPEGAASCRCADTGWTAAAHPEADLVLLESPAGVRLAMTCYYPFWVAWAERSLAVATIQGEILLFEDLRGALEKWMSAAPDRVPSES